MPANPDPGAQFDVHLVGGPNDGEKVRWMGRSNEIVLPEQVPLEISEASIPTRLRAAVYRRSASHPFLFDFVEVR